MPLAEEGVSGCRPLVAVAGQRQPAAGGRGRRRPPSCSCWVAVAGAINAAKLLGVPVGGERRISFRKGSRRQWAPAGERCVCAWSQRRDGEGSSHEMLRRPLRGRRLPLGTLGELGVCIG